MIAPFLISLFVFIACQDQLMTDIKDITSKSTMVDEANYTPNVKKMINKLQTENPSKSYFVMELTEADAKKKFEELESEYKAMLRGVVVETMEFDNRSFTIFEKGERTQQLANLTKGEGEIFTIVDEPATPVGGMPEFYKHIMNKMIYPSEAKTKGIQGRVFIEFIINTDGTLSDIKPLKGIGEICDQEAVRVVSLSPAWLPGKQRGIAVRQRMVLPITFKLAGLDKNIELGQTEKPTLSGIVVTAYPQNKN